MATNAIAGDTDNVTVNMLKTHNAMLGKRAMSLSMSKGAYIKHLIALGLHLEDPKLAAQWRRERVGRWSKSVVLAVVGFVVVIQAFNQAQPLRVLRTARRIEEIICQECPPA